MITDGKPTCLKEGNGYYQNSFGLDRKVKLKGLEMTSPDIRAGVSLLIAALSAEGTSIIHNIEQIERGYQNIDERLLALGANIKRISAEKPSH
jgi:UDP-N-acetylglucosamine 1-carboxyvinyltransferase